jgi:hypothetical protein
MTNDPSSENVDLDSRKLLHWPAREDCLHDLEHHLGMAARLSRALWMALSNEDNNLDDKRDHYALMELASVIADHASAAEFLFQTKGGRDDA